MILLCGGGTGGHLMPLLAVAEQLSHGKDSTHPIHFVGSRQRAERELVEKAGYAFHAIFAGKWRRYFSLRNVGDVFLSGLGFCQSWRLLRRLRPRVVLAKGGYVTLPLAIAAWCQRIPIIVHESDSVPGWSNRLLGKLAQRIITAYPTAASGFAASKVVMLGNPIRQQILHGKKVAGLKWLGFNDQQPVLLIMGGSQGALNLNRLMAGLLPSLVKDWQIVHLTGAGKGVTFQHHNYRALDFVHGEMGDVLAATTVAVTRAGANSLAELADWGIPALIFPLAGSANNHQQLNADYYSGRGAAWTFSEEVAPEVVKKQLDGLRTEPNLRARMSKAMKELAQPKAAEKVAVLVKTIANE